MEFRIWNLGFVWKLVLRVWNFRPTLRGASGGQAAIIAVLFLMSAMLVITGGLSSVALRQASVVRAAGAGAESYFLAEAGVEDIIYRLKTGKSVDAEEVLSDGITTVTTTAVETDGEWTIRAEGSTEDHIRAAEARLTVGSEVPFRYGIQTGEGGFFLENNAIIEGNIYANGSVEGQNNHVVHGTVVSAGPDGRVDGVYATSSVYAEEIEDSFIEGDAYYAEIDGDTTVLGTKHPGSAPLPVLPLPIPEETIDEWEAAATAGGTISSPCPYVLDEGTVTLGPAVIACDFELSGDAALTLGGHLWVQGNITIKNDATVSVASGLSGESVAFIADDSSDLVDGSRALIENSAFFSGNGDGSFVLVLSRNKSASLGGGVNAINIKNNSEVGDLLVYAAKGTVLLENNAALREVAAYRVHAKNNAIVTYETGLASLLFDAGPEGGYDILGWKEVE